MNLGGTVAVPEPLANLPVAKRLDDIPWDAQNIIMRASTGSGKSLVAAPMEILMRKSRGEYVKASMRVPTKTVSGFLTPALKELWGPLGLNVSELNREVTKDEEDAAAIADLIIISDGTLPRLMGLTKLTHYICDEIHQPSLGCELDLAVAKIHGLRLRLMSATVDPRNLLAYLGPDCRDVVLEGRGFPIETDVIVVPREDADEVFSRTKHDVLDSYLVPFAERLVAESKAGMVFLCTRDMCDSAAQRLASTLPTKAIHGGVAPKESEAWARKHAGQPFLAFCTIGAATGVTLNVDEVLIADERIDGGIDSVGMRWQASKPLDDNTMLQMQGRVGRLRPGKATLLTNVRGDGWSWGEVRPREIQPPSEKSGAYEVVLAMANHGLTNDDAYQVLGRINPVSTANARKWFIRNGCLKEDGHITDFGKRILRFPVPPREAHCILTAKGAKMQLAILAMFQVGAEGTYGIVHAKPPKRYRGETWLHPFPVLPLDTLAAGSVPVSMVKLMKALLGVSKDDVWGWAKRNNLSGIRMWRLRKDFLAAAERVLKDTAKSTFLCIDADSPDFRDGLHDHLSRHELFANRRVHLGVWGQPMFDSVYAEAFGLDEHRGRTVDMTYHESSLTTASGQPMRIANYPFIWKWDAPTPIRGVAPASESVAIPDDIPLPDIELPPEPEAGNGADADDQ